MSWLEGEVALVTGGGSGIGRAVVDRFVEEGARVGVVDVMPERLARVKEKHGDRVHAIEADVSSVADNERAVSETVDTFGKLDAYVANAGLWDAFRDVATIPIEDLERIYEKVFAVNVRGAVLGTRAALPELVKTRGSMIVTLSNASFHPDGGGVVYVASKHALLGLVRQLAHELAPAVRVNGVAPGTTRTELGSPDELAGDVPQDDADEATHDDEVERQTPLGLFAEPSDHSGAYLLLASRTEGRLMTGTVITTDGGLGIRGLRRVRGGDDL